MTKEKTPLLDTNVYFRWAPGCTDGTRVEQWNQLRQCWMPSERAIYQHCLHSGDAVVMNPSWGAKR